jgi:hypothetical protein
MFCFHTYNIYMSLLIHSIMKKFQYFIEREKKDRIVGLFTIKSGENKSHNHCQVSTFHGNKNKFFFIKITGNSNG